jgi:hypothetical protein
VTHEVWGLVTYTVASSAIGHFLDPGCTWHLSFPWKILLGIDP